MRKKKYLFLPYSFIGGKVLNDWVSLHRNAVMLNRNFSDPCITGAVIASSFLVWTGSYSLHYFWCNDSIQMGKSDQVESELWVLIRSSCSMEAESLSVGLKTSKHKFHILKSILDLWRYKCRNSKFWNVDLCPSYHKWIQCFYVVTGKRIYRLSTCCFLSKVLVFFPLWPWYFSKKETFYQ